MIPKYITGGGSVSNDDEGSGPIPFDGSPWQWHRLVCDARGISSSERLVLFAACRWVDSAGDLWPAVSSIADAAGLSRRAVQAALRGLESRGVIVAGSGGDGRGSTVRRRLDRDAMAALASGAPRARMVNQSPKEGRTPRAHMGEKGAHASPQNREGGRTWFAPDPVERAHVVRPGGARGAPEVTSEDTNESSSLDAAAAKCSGAPDSPINRGGVDPAVSAAVAGFARLCGGASRVSSAVWSPVLRACSVDPRERGNFGEAELCPIVIGGAPADRAALIEAAMAVVASILGPGQHAPTRVRALAIGVLNRSRDDGTMPGVDAPRELAWVEKAKRENDDFAARVSRLGRGKDGDDDA